MDPATLLGAAGALKGLMGGGTNIDNTLTSNNDLGLNFAPTINVGGEASPSFSGTTTSTPTISTPTTQSNTQAPTPTYLPAVTNSSTLPLGTTPATTTGVTGTLTGSQLLLLGGLGLLLVMSMGGGKKRR